MVLRKMEISPSGKPTKQKMKLTNKVTTAVERSDLTKWATKMIDAAAKGQSNMQATWSNWSRSSGTVSDV